MLLVHPLLHRAGRHVWESFLSTLSILGALVVPIVVCLVVLYLLSSWQTKRLARAFGWRGMLFTGWLGTPVHELSHALAAVLTMHKIEEIALFRPRQATGQLGHVRHSYNPKNPYAAVLGNAAIPLAPFLGGAAVIYLLTVLLMPDLVPDRVISEGRPVAANAFTDSAGYSALAKRSWAYVGHLKRIVLARESWRQWRFYVYAYVVFCVGMHLAPSASDFRNFRTPALLLVILIFLANLAARSFGDLSQWATELFSGPVVALTGLLTFAIAVSLIGAAVTVAVTSLANLISGR